MNSTLAAILFRGRALDLDLTEKEFWTQVENLAANPHEARAQIDRALNKLAENPILEIGFAGDQQGLSIVLFSTSVNEGEDADYAGFSLDLSHFRRSFNFKAGMVNDLILQVRKASASTQGKLGALAKNLEVWPRAIQSDFMDELLAEIIEMNRTLDLSLNLSSSLDVLDLFAERIDLVSLIETIISGLNDPDILFSSQLSEDEPAPLALLDPALTQQGLTYLLEEIQDLHLPGKIEIRLLQEGDILILRLDSPRTLSLPGIPPLSEGLPPDEVSVRLYLARRIITAQGGSMKVERTSIETGDVYRISIRFPLSGSQDGVGTGTQRRDISGLDEGRVLLALSHADQQIRFRGALQDSGYRVDLAVNGTTALDLAQRNNPDLVIVSRVLPELDGLLVTQGIRRWSAMPIIMISDRTNPDDLNYAYQLGVDDYLRIPVNQDELLARARVCIRRSAAAKQPVSPDIYQTNQLKIDYSLQKVWVRGGIVELTPIEYNLLVYMSRHGNQIIPYQQLLENVWEGPEKGTRQGLFVHIKRLREKIEIDPKDPQIVTNKWGVGYVFTS
jgi:two-component system KDP operon response regulator KdpE